MTAEIVLMNRSAVALAADSAVTISVGGTQKIYNSAEKIFELSKICSLGLMLYNSMEFMGFPLEVLIRKFRDEQDRSFQTVKGAADAFSATLSALPISDNNEDNHLFQLLTSSFEGFFDRYRDELTRAIMNVPVHGDRPIGQEVFHSVINVEIDHFSKKQLPDFLDGVSQDQFNERFQNVISEASRVVFNDLPIGADELQLLSLLAFAIVRAQQFTATATGLVFSGYALDDFFPSLEALEVDGRYFGELKCWTSQSRAIDRLDNRAFILPFAQREMVDRFIYGIDGQFENRIAKEVGESAQTVAEQLLNFLNHGRKRKLKLPIGLVGEFMTAVEANFRENVVQRLKGMSLRETYDIMTAMPKSELAQMAESLISVTSMKRRMSIESETVGGPIDVALITRGEGFIWIKRKHYFDPAQNPSFFSRQYKPNKHNGGRNDASK
jgi:hypothetical protein